MNTTVITPTEASGANPVESGVTKTGHRLHRTSRFGAVQIAEDSILHFPAGLIGLGGRHYALISTNPESPFMWLQSLDNPDLALPVIDPNRFFRDFTVELDESDAELIGVDESDSVDVLVTVTAKAEHATANLKAPLLIHAGDAHQVINRAQDASVKAPLFDATKSVSS